MKLIIPRIQATDCLLYRELNKKGGRCGMKILQRPPFFACTVGFGRGACGKNGANWVVLAQQRLHRRELFRVILHILCSVNLFPEFAALLLTIVNYTIYGCFDSETLSQFPPEPVKKARMKTQTACCESFIRRKETSRVSVLLLYNETRRFSTPGIVRFLIFFRPGSCGISGFLTVALSLTSRSDLFTR